MHSLLAMPKMEQVNKTQSLGNCKGLRSHSIKAFSETYEFEFRGKPLFLVWTGNKAIRLAYYGKKYQCTRRRRYL